MRLGRIVRALLLILLGAAGVIFACGPAAIEREGQGVLPHEPYEVSPAARQRHLGLTIADWHTDSLLWNRDLLAEADRGHVDFPRLERGNVAIQMFTAVTKSPRGRNYDRNDASSDNVTLLAVLQRWPIRTWSSLLERAIYQSEKLHRYAATRPEEIVVVRSAAELERVLEARKSGPGRPIATLLGIEGAHALEGEVANVDVLYDAGFRMVGLHHFFDNRLGGSLHGESRGGLTDFGREVVARLEERRILVDVAHSSRQVVEDVLAMTSRPVVVSHTGVTAACVSPRNLPDALMKRIADRGGLVAIGYWKGAVCDVTPAGVAHALRAAIDLLGEDHVALGSDFDGGTMTPFDTAELEVLTAAMINAGFSDREIQKVMGGNAVRLLLAQLPPS